MTNVRKTLVALAALLVASLLVAGPATAKDRNNDRIPDRWEKRHDLSLKVKQTKRDQDTDGLNNLGEFRSKSDPRDSDTDDDGTEDGDENAGVVSSFDGTTLTVDLLNGGSITGTVDDGTEIKCGDECNEDEGHGGDDEDGGHHGHGNGDEDGDDDGSDRRSHGSDDEDESGDDDSSCSVDDLTVGVAIHEAEIELKDGDAVFTEIELAK